MQEIAKILNQVREKNPIVFHVTNFVTINDCANVTLSVGASPLMSLCKEEYEEILSFSSSLVINIGTMNDGLEDLCLNAGKIANKLNVPIVLDPVGVGATSARKNLISKLLKEIKFDVIKGNSAEIKTLLGLDLHVKAGVDSKEDFDDENLVKDLAKRLNTVIAMSGKIDIISDGKNIAKISNGTPLLSKVSGTGCMSASLIASACGVGEDLFSCGIFGMSLMGISGEIAIKNGIKGNGYLKPALLDNIFTLSIKDFQKAMKVEILG